MEESGQEVGPPRAAGCLPGCERGAAARPRGAFPARGPRSAPTRARAPGRPVPNLQGAPATKAPTPTPSGIPNSLLDFSPENFGVLAFTFGCACACKLLRGARRRK